MNPGEFAANPQMLPDGENVLFTLGEQGSGSRPHPPTELGSGSDHCPIAEIGRPQGAHQRWQRCPLFADRTYRLRTRFDAVGEAVRPLETSSHRRAGIDRRRGENARIGEIYFGGRSLQLLRRLEPWPTFRERRERRLQHDRWCSSISNGKVKPLDLPAGRYHSPRFSLPDGKQIALYTSDGVIWIHDLSGTKPIRRLTLEGGHLLPMWTRDGRVVFRSTLVDGQAGLFWQRADGSAVAERLTEPGVRSYFPYSVSPDGKTLVLLTDRSVPASPATSDKG